MAPLIPRALRLGAVPAALALILTGCSSAADEDARATSAPSAPATTGAATPEPDASSAAPSASAAESTPVVLELDGRRMPGTLDDSAASASLIAQLPLTLPLRDFGGQEKVAELPAPLDLDGAPEGSAAPALTIGYYVPDQRLILYYEDVGYYSGIVPLGAFEDTVGIRDLPDSSTVTIRTAD